MVALVGTMEARLLELGWRVVGERKARVGAGVPQHRYVIECMECLARRLCGMRWIDSGSKYMTCPHPAADAETPWEDDLPCRLLVARFGPLTLEETAAALGDLTRERARQIETKALAKFRRGLEREGVSAEEAVEILADADQREARAGWLTEPADRGGGGASSSYDRRVVMTKWIDPAELTGLDRERRAARAEAAAQVDAAIALARSPRDDEPAPPAKEDAMARGSGWTERTCIACGAEYTPSGGRQQRCADCGAKHRKARDAARSPKKLGRPSKSVERRMRASAQPATEVVDVANELDGSGPRALLEAAGYVVREVRTPAGPALFVTEGAS
jgi:hypothetical protein